MRRIAFSAALAACALLLVAAVPALAAGPKWKLTVSPNADYFLSGSEGDPRRYGVYVVEAENVGDQPTSGEVTVKDNLPDGLVPVGVYFFDSAIGNFSPTARGPSDLHEALCPGLLECGFPGSLSSPPFEIHGLNPGQKLIMVVVVAVPLGREGPLSDTATVAGGSAPSAQATITNAAASSPPFGLLHFDSTVSDSAGAPYTQAGGHPDQYSTEFNFETYSYGELQNVGYASDFYTATVRDPKEIHAELPPGLLANPQGVPRCSLAEWFSAECDRKKDSVGVSCIHAEVSATAARPCSTVSPVINLQPEGSYPGELGIPVANTPFVVITAGLRSGSDYGVTATGRAPQLNVYRVNVSLWGAPAASEHNGMRGKECAFSEPLRFRSIEQVERDCAEQTQPGAGGPAGVPSTPFLTMPTQCSGEPLTLAGRYNTWQGPGEFASASVQVPAVDGCNNLRFEPKIKARPTTNLADSPSGLEFSLEAPQNEEPDGDATPSLEEAVVQLPPGLVVNPSSGGGLEGCSEAQLGLHTEEEAHCPDASKLGVVEVVTPLLAEPLDGALYLATPHQNPSNSLLAGYIVLEGQGVKVKLPGRFEPDLSTGQITARFTENPQLPFEELKLNVFGGARGALRTPPACGSYETTSVLTPFSAPESGPPAEPSDEFETISGPAGEGTPCANTPAEAPNAPRFHAGTESPQAGAFSPFALRLVREDGSQELSKIDTTLPPGLVGKLAGVGECTDAALAAAAAPGHSGKAEQAAPSCPANAEVGTVEVGAGAGPTPLYVKGHAYLAGPYKGAPLSLAIITPAVAGPFDLGTVVVRTALYVNTETAQIHAVSDEIPHILQGIPLDVRSVTLKASRPNFTLNSTNCNELSFSGSALSVFGQSAPLSQRFQVGGCSALPFKPKLSLSLKGKTTRGATPAFKAVLTMPPVGANIARAKVALPHSEFLANEHINTVCTKVQLAANACPKGSIYGFAKAETPLLDHPLEGPVYLGTGYGHQLPDLLADLNGQIHVVLNGTIDQDKKHGIRNSFEVVPDAPVSKFTLTMQGGKKGLLQNSENICAKAHRATAEFTGQNGKVSVLEPVLRAKCPKQGHTGKGHGKHHRRRAR